MYDKFRRLYPLADYDGVSASKVWDGYNIIENGKHRTITIKENKGAWINSVVESVKPFVNTIMPMPDETPANCRIKKIIHKNVTWLYAIAITNIPGSYEIIKITTKTISFLMANGQDLSSIILSRIMSYYF